MAKTNNPSGRPDRERHEALKWIRENLSLKDSPVAEIKRFVEDHRGTLGFSWRTLENVKADYQIRHYKVARKSYWTLKTAEQINKMWQDRAPQSMSEDEINAIAAQIIRERGIKSTQAQQENHRSAPLIDQNDFLKMSREQQREYLQSLSDENMDELDAQLSKRSRAIGEAAIALIQDERWRRHASDDGDVVIVEDEDNDPQF